MLQGLLISQYKECIDGIIESKMPTFEQMEQIENVLDEIYKYFPLEIYNTFDRLYTTILSTKQKRLITKMEYGLTWD